MANENITPEERLLRIIENPQGEQRKPILGAKAAGIDIGALAANFKSLHFDKNIFKNINFKMVNRAVLALCVIFTLFTVFNYLKFKSALSGRLVKIISDANAARPAQADSVLPEISISQTLDLAKRRNMFSFLPPVSVIKPGVALDAAQMVSTLKLVGIMWSDNPQAMIEDTKAQKTLLLGTSDQIGELKIKKILKDKVILSKDDQEWDLR